jgi:predicted metal-binding membrane protein
VSDVPPDGALTRLLRRDQLTVALSLTALVVISWAYLFRLADQMAAMPMGTMGEGMSPVAPMAMAWTPVDFALMFVMWWVMMVGMMLPSAAPMILVFDRINRGKRGRGQPFVPTAVFAAGYLGAWGAYSLLATLAEWGLESAALMLPMMHLTSPALGGVVLVVAGVYQFTPLKYACLKHCRSPFAFVMNHWREGTGGALAMGAWHGTFCLGCCWFLMALLFVGGVMNLLWVAAIAGFVLAEKLFPAGQWIARIGGVAMIAAGGYLMTLG